MGFETVEQKLDLTGRFKYEPELEERSIKNYRYWIDKLNIMSNHTAPCWTKLLRHGARITFAEFAPDQDHVQLYRSKDLKRYLVYQPYSLDEEKIQAWAEVRGIKASIYTPDWSWHYPDSTWLVIMEVEDAEKYKRYIKEHKKRELWGWSIK